MPIQGKLEPKALGEESHLPADEAPASTSTLSIDVRLDPGEARTESETLGGNGRSRGQQPAHGEHR